MQNDVGSSQQPTGPIELPVSTKQRVLTRIRHAKKLPTLAVIVMLVGAVGGTALFLYGKTQTSDSGIAVEQQQTIQSMQPSSKTTAETRKTTAETQDAPIAAPSQTSQTPSTQTQSPSTPRAPSTPSTATPPASATGCLPTNPSQYDLYYQHMTNSQYLQTNGYANTAKLYAGLQFAGLLDTVNRKQHVVLTMADGAWDNLSQAQRDWMNASPANMRSVLGWQVITSCITYKGVNPTKDMAAGTTQVVNTLNGSITYTAGGSMGKFENAPVYMWDWYTSNGAVTFSDFVRPPVVP